MKCLACGNEHDGTFGSGKFCRRACSNKRTTIDYSKVSEALRKFPKIKEIECLTCHSVFLPKKHATKTCSKSCAMTMRYSDVEQRKKTSASLKGKTGGWRNFGGNGVKGIHEGYVYQSSWEKIWIIYHLKNGIPFRRCTEFFTYEYEGKTRKYYPDFFLLETNTYVEIKGFWSKQTEAKIDSIPKNFNVKVLMKDDIAGLV